ncbi:MAG: hypothetical protein HYV20_13675 [Gemmatimonadetes bacterium]|nr:hypothetical protein [Gemmatimonadota bacterium]
MSNGLLSAIWFVGAGLTLTLLLTGCEQVVYRDKELFNPPPDTISGFLGYFNVATQQTTCGNCHVGKQAEWAGTGHSRAWEHLQASGHAVESCNACHTVNERGNVVAVAAGYNAVQDSAYHDVQCESCHGPGAQHLAGPEAIQPLASIAVGTDSTNGCGECHQGSHTPYVEEWSASPHGYGGTVSSSGVPLFVSNGPRDPCKNCHEGRQALQINFGGLDPRLSGQTGGERGVYLEANTPGAYQPITCAVCHDPHNAANEGQLRAPLGEPELNQVCVHCHRREGHATGGVATRRGPHGAQGLVVIDEDVGWIPPNWPYTERILPTHSADNPRLCAACHVTAFEIKDAAGSFVKNYTGHLFEAIPCIDQTTGEPIPGGSCSDAQRYFGGCAVSGCHGSAGAARTALAAVRARLNYLTDALWADTDGDAVMETTDGGLLPKVLAQAIAQNQRNVINLYDTSLTVADGAIWNAQLASTHGRSYWLNFKVDGQNTCATPGCTTGGGSNTGHKSSGDGVHNPFLLEALLIESIKAVQTTYGLAPSQALDLRVRATPPAGVRPIK